MIHSSALFSLVILFLFLSRLHGAALSAAHVGINYALELQKNRLDTNVAAALLQKSFPKLTKAKLFGSDSYDQQKKDVQALLNNGISDIMVAIGQKEIYFDNATIESKVTPSYMETYIQDFLKPFLDQGAKLTIAIGNEPFASWVKTPPKLLLDTYKIVRQALIDNGLKDKVKCTIPFHMGIMANDDQDSRPPYAYFQPQFADALREISLQLHADGDFFTMNMYTWFAYFDSTDGTVKDNLLTIALGNTTDPDAFMLRGMYSATQTALQKLDPALSALELAIGETGWPTSLTLNANGGTVPAASPEIAQFYMENAIALGVPIYIFEAFDEQMKSVDDGAGNQISDVENHWGTFYENGTLKYDIPSLMGDQPEEPPTSAAVGIFPSKSTSFAVALLGAVIGSLLI